MHDSPNKWISRRTLDILLISPVRVGGGQKPGKSTTVQEYCGGFSKPEFNDKQFLVQTISAHTPKKVGSQIFCFKSIWRILSQNYPAKLQPRIEESWTGQSVKITLSGKICFLFNVVAFCLNCCNCWKIPLLNCMAWWLGWDKKVEDTDENEEILDKVLLSTSDSSFGFV